MTRLYSLLHTYVPEFRDVEKVPYIAVGRYVALYSSGSLSCSVICSIVPESRCTLLYIHRTWLVHRIRK